MWERQHQGPVSQSYDPTLIPEADQDPFWPKPNQVIIHSHQQKAEPIKP